VEKGSVALKVSSISMVEIVLGAEEVVLEAFGKN
jgi:hypothetical protein